MKDTNINSIALSEMYEELEHETNFSNMKSRDESKERENITSPIIDRTSDSTFGLNSVKLRKEQQLTDSSSWMSYASFICMLIALGGLLWNFLPSNNKAEAVSQVAAKPVPVVETKYITKNIEDIQEGDEVLAYDVRTGETVKSQVTSTIHLKCDHLRYLTVRDNNGIEQTFQTTDTHPFWVNSDRPDLYRRARDSVSEHDISTNTDVRFEHDNLYVTETGYYVEAKDLKLGDNFIGPNGEASVLVKIWREAHSEGIDVYNFKVADNSNYFVIANYADFQNGADPVLVHNAEACGADFKHYTDIKELAKQIGIDSSQIHLVKAKILSEARKIPDVNKALKKIGYNPDILLSGRIIGLRSRLNSKWSINTTLNIDDILANISQLH